MALSKDPNVTRRGIFTLNLSCSKKEWDDLKNQCSVYRIGFNLGCKRRQYCVHLLDENETWFTTSKSDLRKLISRKYKGKLSDEKLDKQVEDCENDEETWGNNFRCGVETENGYCLCNDCADAWHYIKEQVKKKKDAELNAFQLELLRRNKLKETQFVNILKDPSCTTLVISKAQTTFQDWFSKMNKPKQEDVPKSTNPFLAVAFLVEYGPNDLYVYIEQDRLSNMLNHLRSIGFATSDTGPVQAWLRGGGVPF